MLFGLYFVWFHGLVMFYIFSCTHLVLLSLWSMGFSQTHTCSLVYRFVSLHFWKAFLEYSFKFYFCFIALFFVSSSQQYEYYFVSLPLVLLLLLYFLLLSVREFHSAFLQCSWIKFCNLFFILKKILSFSFFLSTSFFPYFLSFMLLLFIFFEFSY